MQQARAVLMDIDGTLLDSAEAQTQCWLNVLRDFEYPVEYRQVRARIGMGSDRMLRELCGISEASPRARRILPIRRLLLRCQALREIRAFPQACQFLRQVQATGAKLAIVTSLFRSEALALLGAARLLTDFDHLVCKEDVAQSKPAPDGVRFALDLMGVRPDQALLVGSSPYDLAAAHGARVPCVALRSGGWPESALLGSSHAYNDLSDLLQQWQGSPLAMLARELWARRGFAWRSRERPRRGEAARRAARPSRPHAA